MANKKLVEIDHPLIQHKLSIIRDVNTNATMFRNVLDEITQYMAYEVTRDLKTTKVDIETPLEKTKGIFISDELILVPIMRAGLGMLSGMAKILPFARIGHIGIYRDKFIQTTVEYYFRLPKSSQGKRIFILDPLLATGDTVVAAIDRLKQYEVGPIRLVCLLAAPEGVKNVQECHPDVEIYTAKVDRQLSEKGYILPGLGDAGDRLYDTV